MYSRSGPSTLSAIVVSCGAWAIGRVSLTPRPGPAYPLFCLEESSLTDNLQFLTGGDEAKPPDYRFGSKSSYVMVA
jgi:hypothetical protein